MCRTNYISSHGRERKISALYICRQDVFVFIIKFKFHPHHHHSTDENNSLSTAIPDKPISLKLFLKLCEQRRKFPVLYKLEFQAVKVETNSCKHANRRNNAEKNQNQVGKRL